MLCADLSFWFCMFCIQLLFYIHYFFKSADNLFSNSITIGPLKPIVLYCVLLLFLTCNISDNVFHDCKCGNNHYTKNKAK